MNPDTGGHDLRRQTPVRRGSMAAEPRDVATVQSRAHGEGAFGGPIIGKATDARVRLCNNVELAVSPHNGVELTFPCSPSGKRPGGSAQTHVDDQGLDRDRESALLGTLGRFGQEVHPPKDSFSSPGTTRRQHFGEADVPHCGRHAGESRLDISVAGNGPGDMGPMAEFVDPQVLGLAERSVGSPGTPHEVGAADALPVGGDVQVIDVEPRVHDADGDRSAVYP